VRIQHGDTVSASVSPSVSPLRPSCWVFPRRPRGEPFHRYNCGRRYSWFCERCKEWACRLKLSMRRLHIAGEKLFVDYSGHTMEVIDGLTGEVLAAQIFVAVLGPATTPMRTIPGMRTQFAGTPFRPSPRPRQGNALVAEGHGPFERRALAGCFLEGVAIDGDRLLQPRRPALAFPEGLKRNAEIGSYLTSGARARHLSVRESLISGSL
jgi:hypothetical protein